MYTSIVYLPLRAMSVLVTGIVVFALLLAGCSSDTSSSDSDSAEQIQPGTLHPTEQNKLSPAEVDATIAQSDTSSDIPALTTLRDRLRQIVREEPHRTVGTRQGTRREVIGSVADATVLPDGRVLLLDGSYNEIRVIDADNTVSSTIGQEGRGPGEFMSPKRLLQLDGDFIVLDRSNQVDRFTQDGESFVHVDRFNLPGFPDDLCVLADTLYAHSPDLDREASIHRISRDGERTASFGWLYESPNAFVRSNISDGAIACNSTTRRIVSGLWYLPHLRAYAPDGSLQWVVKLTDVDPLPRKELVNENGGTRLTNETENRISYTGIWRIRSAENGAIIVQVRKESKAAHEQQRPYEAIQTYLVDTQTGEGIYVGDQLPPLLYVGNTHIVAGVNTPYPNLQIWELDGPDTD